MEGGIKVNRITIGTLQKYLWGAAEILRGHMGAAEYKQYIFPLLFWKRINDVWEEERKNDQIKYGQSFPETFSINLPENSLWEFVRGINKDVGAGIITAMRAIENTNPSVLSGIFGDAQWTNKNKLTDASLIDLMEHFSSLTLNLEALPEDEMGTGYEYLIKKFADDSGHTAAEFYTNRTVVHLMVDLLRPESGETIYDPTCGSGGMLISSVHYQKQTGREYRNIGLYGQEINLLTSSIARMNLYLHGVMDFEIKLGDTISNPMFIENNQIKTFNVVLANPPYSIKRWNRHDWISDKWGRNRFGTPNQGNADYAFLQHILCSMDQKNGRSATLFPNGVLFRNAESEMRANIVKTDIIEAVICLGPNLFYNSPMESCVIICNNNKRSKLKNKILFIDARKEIVSETNMSHLGQKNISTISDAYSNLIMTKGFSRIVDIKEIKSNDFDLKIDYYVSQVEKKKNGKLGKELLEDWEYNKNEIEIEMNTLFDMIYKFNKDGVI